MPENVNLRKIPGRSRWFKRGEEWVEAFETVGISERKDRVTGWRYYDGYRIEQAILVSAGGYMRAVAVQLAKNTSCSPA